MGVGGGGGLRISFTSLHNVIDQSWCILHGMYIGKGHYSYAYDNVTSLGKKENTTFCHQSWLSACRGSPPLYLLAPGCYVSESVCPSTHTLRRTLTSKYHYTERSYWVHSLGLVKGKMSYNSKLTSFLKVTTTNSNCCCMLEILSCQKNYMCPKNFILQYAMNYQNSVQMKVYTYILITLSLPYTFKNQS